MCLNAEKKVLYIIEGEKGRQIPLDKLGEEQHL